MTNNTRDVSQSAISMLMWISRLLFVRGLSSSSRVLCRAPSVTELYTWNVAMTESNKRQTPNNTLLLFDRLISDHPEISPNFITYLLALSACIRLGNLQEGKRIHRHIREQWATTVEKSEEIKIHTSLIQLYSSCGDLKTAEEIFYREDLDQRAMPVNALIKGYLLNHRPDAAVQLAERLEKQQRNSGTYHLWATAIAQLMDAERADRIHEELKSLPSSIRDRRLLNALIHMDGKCGNIRRMEETFQSMRDPDIITFTSMAKAYVINDLPLKALSIYDHLKEKHREKCDEVIYLVAANAAGKVGLLSRARSIHSDLIDSGLPYQTNLKIVNTLMDTYGKCGDLKSAREIFDGLINPTKPSISSMINIYGINSQALEAVALFYRSLKNLSGNIQSIWISVLTACAHGGLVQEAQKIFDEIPEDKRSVKIWNILVDVYGRAGHLDEAHQIIRRFETHHPRVPVLYISLLAACRVHRNAVLASEIYETLLHSPTALNSDQRSAITVLTANVHSSIGDHRRSSTLRENLSREKLVKYTGVTWTEIDGVTFEFHAHDTRHPRTKEIYEELFLLHEQLKEHGYQPNAGAVNRETFDLESNLFGHSERLAIVWNLLSTPAGTTIQLTKNLRMCVDCHEVSKLIARRTQREIIVRDRLRIHHFTKDGRCSCANHF